ncbi:hypothetical protein [Nocardia sp. NPDC050710]|uniref:hypothetical protein n=1 Tax=Nocardia sp. NPDC050710 TaxID=3157220 RepID=UPI003409F5AB
MSGNEVDEVARSHQQLLQIILQLAYTYRRAHPPGIRLPRKEAKEFQRQLDERVRLQAHERVTSLAWYEARVAEYRNESAIVTVQDAAGTISPDDRVRAGAYLAGMRSGIEHTIHSTSLTPEERGQVVQALDSADADPRTGLQHKVFGPLTKKEKVFARFSAAQSEQAHAQYHEQLEAKKAAAEQARVRQEHEAPVFGDSSALAQLRHANTSLQQQVSALTAENSALKQQVQMLQARQTTTATASSNGHVVAEDAAEHHQRPEAEQPAAAASVRAEAVDQAADLAADVEGIYIAEMEAEA